MRPTLTNARAYLAAELIVAVKVFDAETGVTIYFLHSLQMGPIS